MTTQHTSPHNAESADSLQSRDEAKMRFTHPVTGAPLVYPDGLTAAQDLAPVPVFEHGYGPVSFDGLVPVEVVVDRVFPAYGGSTLREAFDMLLSSPSEKATIDLLVAELRSLDPANGPMCFRSPVVVREVEPDWDDIVDTDDKPASFFEPNPHVPSMWAAGIPAFRIANGMHRTCAAWLAGASHLLCASDYPDADADLAGNGERIEVRFTVPSSLIKATREDGDAADSTGWDWDAMDYALGWLRSFPLANRVWVEGEGFSGEHTAEDAVLTVIYDCRHEDRQLLLDEMVRRAPGLHLIEVNLTTDAELWAELDAESSPDPSETVAQ